MEAISASHSRAADSTSVSRTVFKSKVDRLITLRTSAVAVCRWRDSGSSFSRRVFSIAMTAWAAKHQLDLLVGEWAHLLTVDNNCSDNLVVLKHRHAQRSARVCLFCKPQIAIDLNRLNIGDMNRLLSFYNLTHRRLAWHNGIAAQCLFECRRSAMHRT